jgi:hypothetical protein
LQPTISLFSLLIVPRHYKKLTTEGGLQKVEMLLQKRKQNSRRSKLNETLIVLKKQKFENLQTEIFVDVEGYRGNPQAYGFNHP